MLLELPFWAENRHHNSTADVGTPALDIFEDGDNLMAVIELPGMRREDIDLTFHDGVLTIAGERQSPRVEGQKMTRNERFFGTFKRQVSVPNRADGVSVTASYQDGVLTVTLPKANDAKPKQIQVNVG